MAVPAATRIPSNTHGNNLIPPQASNQREPNTERVTSCCENPLLKKIGLVSLAIISFAAQGAIAIGLGTGSYLLFQIALVSVSNPPLFIATACLAAIVGLMAINLTAATIVGPILFANYI